MSLEQRFKGWFVPRSSRIDPILPTGERFAYIGDIHGGGEKLDKNLEALKLNPPHHLILTGDLSGSPQDTRFKYLYYEVLNPARPVLDGNRDISDESLVGYQVPNSQETLGERYRDLERLKLKLLGLPSEEADQRVTQLTDQQIAEGIRNVYKPPYTIYYARWVASLPSAIRRAVLDTEGSNIKALASQLEILQQGGTRVHIVEGNWDPIDRGGFWEMAGEGVQPFDSLGYLQEKGAEVFRSVGAFKTGTSVHVMWPIYPVMDGKITDAEMAEIEKMVKSARRRKKAVLQVAHLEPDWRTHFLNIPNARHGTEYVRAGENLRALLPRLGPSEIVYGHQHNVRKDEEGESIDANARYCLMVNRNGSSQTVWDLDQLKDPRKIITATYLPLGNLATLTLQREPGLDRRLNALTGSRESVLVVD